MKKHIDDNCIFCKLANGQIPTNSIYEDDDFKVILDAAPAAKGHAIILPKTHAANLFELPEEYGEKILWDAGGDADLYQSGKKSRT